MPAARAPQAANVMGSAPGGGGATDVLSAVMEQFNQPAVLASSSGLNVNDLVNRLASRWSRKQVMDAVDSLAGNGQLYTTVDDCHFRSTDQ